MKTVQILEADDIVLPTDWCRPLQLVTMCGGHSDDYSFRSMGGRPENNVKWVPANYVLGPAWFEKPHTLAATQFEWQACEFVRGDIPENNKMDLREFDPIGVFIKSEAARKKNQQYFSME